MLGYYFKTAIRNIAKQRGLSAISIFGLATGMASCILLCLWAYDELGYDSFHSNEANIFRVVQKHYGGEGVSHSASMPAPIGPGVASTAPGVIDYTRVYNSPFLLTADDKRAMLSHAIVDPSFLSIFTFPLLQGDSLTCLADPYSVVLTQKAATALFGDKNPIGKRVQFDSEFDLTVTAVIPDPPRNSHLTFDVLVPISLYEAAGYDLSNWGDARFATYVQLYAGASVMDANELIKYYQRVQWPDNNDELRLQRLSDVHLRDLEGGGLITYVRIFLTVALVILIIACINYGNMTTASYTRRIRSLGLRRVLGGSRGHLAAQVMSEVGVTTLIAFMLALLLVETSLPLFNKLAEKQLSFGFGAGDGILPILAGIALITTVLAGIYPTLFLSSYRTVAMLRASATGLAASKAGLIRRFLVVFQFVCCIVLVIGTAVVYEQLEYIRSEDLGFEKENILVARMDNLNEDYQLVKEEIGRIPGILQTTVTFAPPAWASIGTAGLDFWDGQGESPRFSLNLAMVDHDYIETFGMRITQGRSFSRDFPTDAGGAYIVSEKTVAAMGMEDPIGKKMAWNNIEGEIIGVIEDFHMRPLNYETEPFAMLIVPWYNYLCVKIDDRAEGVVDRLRLKWQTLRPGQEFKYDFLEDIINRRYRSEARTGSIIGSFSILALALSCLGLLALSLYSAGRRTKEISIRKVLGASEGSVFRLLAGESLLLVVIASIVGCPVAYYATSRWLNDFAYRIDLGFELFLLAVSLVFVVALASVSYQAIRAARANPVDSLRSE